MTSTAIHAAVAAFEQISDTSSGARGQRASVVALVLRGVAAGPESGDFLRRRAERELEQVESTVERGYLRRILAGQGRSEGLGVVLGEYAGDLAEARRLDEADAVIALARTIEPGSAELALRAARVARLRGARERALSLYGKARELDGGGGGIARLAAIGRAVAGSSERELSAAVRDAIQAGDAEAAAVGLEERARLRREAGDRSGAARDFGAAAARFPDSVDRARVAHQLADLFIAAGDPAAAREALLFALSSGDRSQRAHARARLHTVSRDLGDRIGMRRWRSFEAPVLVSLSARPLGPADQTAAPGIARWRERVEALLALPTD